MEEGQDAGGSSKFAVLQVSEGVSEGGSRRAG